MKIIYYESVRTGRRYDAADYQNHGYGGMYRGRTDSKAFMDLPRDEYPFRAVYDDATINK